MKINITNRHFIVAVLILQLSNYAKSVNVPNEISNTHSTVNARQAKDLHHYQEEPEPQPQPDFTPSYYTAPYSRVGGSHGCPTNPVTSFIGRQLNYILFKIGVVALIKAIFAGLLLFKIPLFFLKAAFLKTFLFPVLIAPLLVHMFANEETTSTMKPAEEAPPTEMNESGMGRIIEDDLTMKIWRSLRMFAESEQCVERVACFVGAYNKDSPTGATFGRALKLFERSSPLPLQKRMMSVREAYKTGVLNGFCSENDFTCHGPELFMQQGPDKMRLF